MSDTLTLDDLKKHLFLALGEDEELDLTDAEPDDVLRDRGVDSLAVIDARRRIERELDVTFTDVDADGVETFGDLLAVVRDAQLQSTI